MPIHRRLSGLTSQGRGRRALAAHRINRPKGEKMKQRFRGVVASTLIGAAALTAHAQSAAPVAVTVDNFARAESDRYFDRVVKRGALGRFMHARTLMPVEAQTVVRGNRDTLYSSAVFDLDAGPVTVSMPDAGHRYMSMSVFNEDHYVAAVHYGAGRYVLSKENVGTRYALVGVRTMVDPRSADDVRLAHAMQDAIAVSQPGGPGRFEIPAWNMASQDALRHALVTLGATVPDSRGMFGAPGKVDPVRHLVGSAIAWGGIPERDAFYLIVNPARNDGKTGYRLDVPRVPVDGFWSISVYNAAGYFEPNAQQAYTINNLTAKAGPDGAVSIRFGNCAPDTPNCLPTMPGWNYMVRFYLPHAEILDGRWKFPQAQAAS
ncbi:carboxylesterase [Cupriavidus pinatubonensis]|nr:carboxylesterase [Cupriavidus pinatubonensis]